MTETQILEQVITELSMINIPVAYTEQIANPIKRNVDLLKALYSAVINSTTEQKQKNQEESVHVEEQPIPEEPEVNQNGTNE